MKININKLIEQMRTINTFKVFTVFTFLLICSSCSVKKYVPDDSMVLKKNTIKIDASEVHTRTIVTNSELSDYILLPPNKSTLNMNLWAYNLKQTRVKRWVQGIIENPPSYYNHSKAEQSEIRITSYLNNRGYFNSKVYHTVTTKKNNHKKSYVTYNVKLEKPYSIRSIDYNIPDTTIAKIITPDFFESTVKVGQQYDFYRLDDVRTNIIEILRNRGYLFFTSDYVFYEIDSMNQDYTLKVTLNIRPNYILQEEENLDNNLYNKVFYFNNIYVRTNYRPGIKQESIFDTIPFLRPRYQKIHDTLTYHIIESGPAFMRYKALMPSIFIEPGDLYIESNIKKNQSLISSLSAIGYNNIVLDTTSRIFWPDTANVGLINARFDLSKGTRQGFNVGVEATNNMGALGTSLNFSYNNNNIFKGSELFSLQFKLATEIQSDLGENDMNYSFWMFNTLEGGVQASFTFQKFLAPFNQYKFSKFFRPKTIMSIGYNFQKRPDYNRDILLTTFGYYWKPQATQSHKLTVLDVNIVKIYKNSVFENELLAYNNKRLYEQYSDHLIMGSNYTFTYSNQIYGKAKDFVYIQANLESGGNLLGGISNLINAPKTTSTEGISYYTLFNIRYAQYLKTSVEFRQYKYFGNYNHFAYRTYLGIGVPYGNAISLPFEKSFYAGGANDLRGWGINIVGPGGYINESRYESSGDIKLEANAEYRFGIASFVKGALFTDAGNVWLLREDKSFPEGHFDFSKFYQQIYWDAGFGLRLDFSFFIIRVDAAIPIYSPGSTYSTNWVVNKLNFTDIVLNFGIGYPF